MPLSDDDGFEAYLKQFRPLAPEPLAASGVRHLARRKFAIWVGAVAAVAILVVASAYHFYKERSRAPETPSASAGSDRIASGQPLTLRTANALLEKSQSFRVLVDDMAFRSQTVPVPKGKLSAIAVLSKERNKL